MNFQRLAPLLSFVLALVVPAFAMAQNTAAKETTIPGGTLMLLAYIALWVLILGYVALLSRRQASLDHDVETLRRRLDDLFGDE